MSEQVQITLPDGSQKSAPRGQTIHRLVASDPFGTDSFHGANRAEDTNFQPFHAGFRRVDLLSCGRRAFTLQADRPVCGGGAISTEEWVLCNFLRTKPLLWEQEGALFCLRGTYNGAQLHVERGVVASGPPADGAPSRRE